MHVFLSYARADNETVQPLSSVLRAVGIRPWIDTSGLPPGTPQWDHMVRNALRDAHAVIAVCSENARDSEYVAIELAIARGYQKRIFPVWVAGVDWTQCAPVALVLSQYIDLRRPVGREGVTDLIRALKRYLAACLETASADKWPLLRIEWIDKHLYLNPFSYANWGELLSEVFLSLVGDSFEPFSYGETWALEISRSENPFRIGGWPLFALPAIWAAAPFKGVHEVDPAWVHSAADLELTSIIDDDRDQRRSRSLMRPEDHLGCSKVRVIDLRTLPRISEEMRRYEHQGDELNPKDNFIGLNCRCRTFWSFAAGTHPKMTVMRLSGEGRTRDACSQAFEHFAVPEPRFQAVTIRTSYFDRAISWQLAERVSKTDVNVIEFK